MVVESRRGTEVAATLYTVIETAKLHDIDPAAYLHAAILAGDRGELLLPEQVRRAAAIARGHAVARRAYYAKASTVTTGRSEELLNFVTRWLRPDARASAAGPN